VFSLTETMSKILAMGLGLVDGLFDLTDGFETLAAEQRIVSHGCVRAGAWMPVRTPVPT
jgi:hypothetical protein